MKTKIREEASTLTRFQLSTFDTFYFCSAYGVDWTSVSFLEDEWSEETSGGSLDSPLWRSKSYSLSNFPSPLVFSSRLVLARRLTCFLVNPQFSMTLSQRSRCEIYHDSIHLNASSFPIHFRRTASLSLSHLFSPVKRECVCVCVCVEYILIYHESRNNNLASDLQ